MSYPALVLGLLPALKVTGWHELRMIAPNTHSFHFCGFNFRYLVTAVTSGDLWQE